MHTSRDASEEMTASETQTRFLDYVSEPIVRSMPAFVSICASTALVVGWLRRDEEILTPKSGTGYWLGVAGATAMLLPLVYSYRKRRRRTALPGSIPTWFRIHMLLGVVGPMLVLYHSNFRLGATNSNVALFTMLIVMTSGAAGRYVYGKIHVGLNGRKALARQMFSDVREIRQELGHELEGMDDLIAELSAFGRHVLDRSPPGAFSSLWRGAVLVAQSHLLRRHIAVRVNKEIRHKAIHEGWSRAERRRRAVVSEAKICALFDAILKAMELRFYERLFALWHVLHLPLFFVMVAAGIVHVWAVHRF
jgi:hypothetical protein